ncbi:sugar ABC transporter ATP-binding protein [Nocardioides sp. 1609]|uniref:sugar ABC transporter ATP-binding protein n=1 Tax=Nocardioides sp. 1609 TaxID=2508327 RepID=UPI0010701BD8|nr:sugar ABC transporter ATP-binding protein [Nocardioides sp. 1609]
MLIASEISKHYGGVQALDGVDLRIESGEVHALLGANGAGKSTLVKILVGAETPTTGSLTLDGEPAVFKSVREAADRGIAIVSQELNLFPDLDVLHNLFLPRIPAHAGVINDRRAMRRRAQAAVDAVGLKVDLDRRLGTLRLGEQQLVEIARALIDDPKVLILDEPTSALQAAEAQRLLQVVRNLRERGVGVVYVSHFLEDVFAIADVITVLRNGKTVVDREARQQLSITTVVSEMLGDLDGTSMGTRRARASTRADLPSAQPLTLRDVHVSRSVHPFSMVAEPGEVVGLAGLDGSGVHTIFEILFGQRRINGGSISLPGGQGAPRSINKAVRAGVAYVPADRKRLGVMLAKSVSENVSTVSGGPLRRRGLFLRRRKMIEQADRWARRLDIKMDSATAPVGHLSGGNQQKVVFAKWLDTDPSVVLLDDPLRGVDVGAKREIFAHISQLAAEGRIVLFTSSDLKETAEICDRVIVFFQGHACGELAGEDLSEHRLLMAINTGTVELV